jgi:cystathionine beta-synthase
MMTREIVRHEGIFAGNSAGSAIAGLLQLKNNFKAGEVVVVIFHDHGTRYLGKMFNDDWMREKGYFDIKGLTARDLVTGKKPARSAGGPSLVTVESSVTVHETIELMSKNDFSQIPVTKQGRIVGSISEPHLFHHITKNPELKIKPVETIMQQAFPFVDISTPIDSLSEMITSDIHAVLVRDFKTDNTYIITRNDILLAYS